MADNVNKVIEKATDCQEWSDLFKLSAHIIKNDIRCHTLARFVEFEEHYDPNKRCGIAKMQPFPLIGDQQPYTIRCYYFKEESEQLFLKSQGDGLPKIPDTERIFLVAFMDYNFKTNIEVTTPIKTSDKSVHDMSFGVIIDTL